jgi:hypothetical protein
MTLDHRYALPARFFPVAAALASDVVHETQLFQSVSAWIAEQSEETLIGLGGENADHQPWWEIQAALVRLPPDQ